MMPELSLPSDVPPLPPDTQRRNTTVTLPAFMNNWTFDVHLRTRDPLLISGNLANGAMSVDAHIGGTGAAPVATGGGTIDRLLVKLPFSQVKVTSGFVTLNADRLLDPALDIRGESRIGNYDITMYVYGDSSNPKTRFISVPPLPEHDIVALIATGATLNGSSSEAGAEAAGRAAVFYLTELYRKIFKKKKVVREDPQRLHITFNPSTAERSTSDTIRVTYDLTERWRITGGYAQTGRVRGFLAYLLRFGKAAKAVDENNPDLARTRATPNAPSAPAAPDASK